MEGRLTLKKELTLFEAKYVTDRNRAVKRLRRLADAVEAGRFRMGGHLVEMPGEMRIKLQCESSGGAAQGEIEIELLWYPGESSKSKLET